MRTENAKQPKRQTAKHTASGSYGDVVLVGDALHEYNLLQQRANSNSDQNSVRQARTIDRYLQRYADIGPRGFGDKMYKPQSRVKLDGNRSVHIFEFKAYQFRLYGAEANVSGRRTFVATGCDPAKKKDKANPTLLKKAAEAYRGFIDGQ